MRGPLWAAPSERCIASAASTRIFSTNERNILLASTADIKNGVVLSIDGQLWSVIEFQHVKPGKGGAFVRTKLKNVTVALHEGLPLYVELPASVVLEITYTEPGLQGDRSSAGTKVKVDTRTGGYLGRIND